MTDSMKFYIACRWAEISYVHMKLGRSKRHIDEWLEACERALELEAGLHAQTTRI